MQPTRTARNGVLNIMDQTEQPIRRRSAEERQAYVEGFEAAINVIRNKGLKIATLSLTMMKATSNVPNNTKEAPVESEESVPDPEDGAEDNGEDTENDGDDAGNGEDAGE